MKKRPHIKGRPIRRAKDERKRVAAYLKMFGVPADAKRKVA